VLVWNTNTRRIEFLGLRPIHWLSLLAAENKGGKMKKAASDQKTILLAIFMIRLYDSASAGFYQTDGIGSLAWQTGR
jgi:hypothetical protein